jgi:triacylglycerol lipase
MNAPIPKHYDPENARALVQCAAASYGSDMADASDVITNENTDTRAVIYQPTEQDLVVAFRGTRSLRNFVTDLRARRVAFPAGGPGRAEVHEGFQRALDSVCAALHSSVQQLAGGPGSPRLWITGHSLGAALAKLFAMRCQLAIAGVYTFGEPRVGNAAFRDHYNALLKSCTFRVVDGEDFITRIPWLLGMYRHSGTEVFYSALPALPSPLIDPPWWEKGFSDVFGTWQEYHAAHRIALLADHQISRYVALLNSRWGETPSNANPIGSHGSTESRPTVA